MLNYFSQFAFFGFIEKLVKKEHKENWLDFLSLEIHKLLSQQASREREEVRKKGYKQIERSFYDLELYRFSFVSSIQLKKIIFYKTKIN